MKPTAIQCTFNKAQTTVDGGWRLTFDTGEEMAKAVAELTKKRGEVLYLVVMTRAQYETGTDE